MTPVDRIPTDFMLQFGATWLVVMAYLGSLVGLALRLRRLGVERPGLDVPSIDFRQANLGFEFLRVLGFAFSRRHGEIGDRSVSRLVTAVRILFVVALLLVLGVFVRAASLGSLGAAA